MNTESASQFDAVQCLDNPSPGQSNDIVKLLGFKAELMGIPELDGMKSLR